jgi:hypothetical protein
MIDEEWLDRALRFDLPGGYRFSGVGGIGGSNVVIKFVYPDGQHFAVRLPKQLFLFPSYIHEIPNWLAPHPMYDVNRLNRKLAKLEGDPLLDVLVETYDTFFSSFVYSAREADAADFDLITGESEESTRAIRFVLATPPIARRLDNLASSAENLETRAWALQARKAVDRIRPGDPELLPLSLLNNPLFVWGAAICSGYLTKAEFPLAANAVRERLKTLSEAQKRAFQFQALLLIDGIRLMLGSGAVSGLAAFCDSTGLFDEEVATEEEREAPDEFLDISGWI